VKRLLAGLVFLLGVTGASAQTDPVTAPNYNQAFTSETTVSLTHGLGTNHLIVACYDGSEVQIAPSSVTIGAAAPFNVDVVFSGSTTGRCVVNAGSGGKYYTTFSSQTTITITAADLMIDAYKAQITCYDNGTPRRRVEPDSSEIDNTTGDLTIYFYTAQSGRCTVS